MPPFNITRRFNMGNFHTKIAFLSVCLMSTSVTLIVRKYVNVYTRANSNPSDDVKHEVNIYHYDETATDNFECIDMYLLSRNVRTPICIYKVSVDAEISGSIQKFGIYEKENIETMSVILEHNLSMELLDISCNIGVYTLFVAKLGRKVVAVDANRNNLQRLGKSLKLGDLSEKVTLIWNGISDKYERLSMTIPDTNNGAGRLSPTNMTKVIDKNRVSVDFLVQTITIEDILPFVKDKSMFMKMDIESFEYILLRGARDFFESVDIPYVQMEFVFYTKISLEATEIITFFYKEGISHLTATANWTLLGITRGH